MPGKITQIIPYQHTLAALDEYGNVYVWRVFVTGGRWVPLDP